MYIVEVHPHCNICIHFKKARNLGIFTTKTFKINFLLKRTISLSLSKCLVFLNLKKTFIRRLLFLYKLLDFYFYKKSINSLLYWQYTIIYI